MTVTRSQNPGVLACGPLCPDEYGVFMGSANTHAVFFSITTQFAKGFKKKFTKLTIDSPVAMAKLAIDRASIVFGKISGDFHSKSGDREIFIILSKIGRSPEKSVDLEALIYTLTEYNKYIIVTVEIL